jgi:hypothetical protein
VNPPVHGWAKIFLYRTEQALRGKTDVEFLTRVFGKLTSNFGWWVNRKDRFGRNLFGPQRAIADWRLPPAGRRHGLGSPVRAEHARDRH